MHRANLLMVRMADDLIFPQFLGCCPTTLPSSVPGLPHYRQQGSHGPDVVSLVPSMTRLPVTFFFFFFLGTLIVNA
jgi:hypothetical protein